MDARRLGQELYGLGLEQGGLGTVLIGSAGGSLARALARCAGCGAALAGGEVRFHDGSCAACGVWLAECYGIPAALFVRQEGGQAAWSLWNGREYRTFPAEAAVRKGGENMGKTPQAEQEYSFTQIAARHSAPVCTGEWDLLAGADCAWAARRAGEYRGPLGPAYAEGPAALTLALERLGYEVADRPVPGAPRFAADTEGFCLRVEAEGAVFAPPGEDALAALADFTRYPHAVPAFWPRGGEPKPS